MFFDYEFKKTIEGKQFHFVKNSFSDDSTMYTLSIVDDKYYLFVYFNDGHEEYTLTPDIILRAKSEFILGEDIFKKLDSFFLQKYLKKI